MSSVNASSRPMRLADLVIEFEKFRISPRFRDISILKHLEVSFKSFAVRLMLPC